MACLVFACDVKTVPPTVARDDIYRKVKQEVIELGIPLEPLLGESKGTPAHVKTAVAWAFDARQQHWEMRRSVNMKTIVRSEKKTVAIDTDGPFVIIGE